MLQHCAWHGDALDAQWQFYEWMQRSRGLMKAGTVRETEEEVEYGTETWRFLLQLPWIAYFLRKWCSSLIGPQCGGGLLSKTSFCPTVQLQDHIPCLLIIPGNPCLHSCVLCGALKTSRVRRRHHSVGKSIFCTLSTNGSTDQKLPFKWTGKVCTRAHEMCIFAHTCFWSDIQLEAINQDNGKGKEPGTDFASFPVLHSNGTPLPIHPCQVPPLENLLLRDFVYLMFLTRHS